jgi:hypothetical protein
MPTIPAGTPAADHIAAFENDPGSGVFGEVSEADVISDVIAIVTDPVDHVNQGQTGLCGPAAIEFELVRRDPAHFVDIVHSIFEAGSFRSGTATYTASQDLRDSPVHPSLTPANWLFMATLRDSGNVLLRITAQTDPNSLAWVTLPWEMPGWIQQILGLSNVESVGVPTPVGPPDQVVMSLAHAALQAGGAAFLLVDSSLVGNPPVLVNFPDHYVDLTSWDSNSPNPVFTVETWGSQPLISVTWSTFYAKTFEVYWAN